MSYHRPVTPELTPQALAGWLRTQDPDAGYTYQDPAMCLLGFYFRAHDADEGIAEAAYETMPEYRQIAEAKPHTFGAALERTEQLLALPAPAAAPSPVRQETIAFAERNGALATTEEPLPHANQDQKETVTLQAPFVEAR